MTQKKYGLGLHTTTRELGLAISNFDQDSRFQVWDLGHELSNSFHAYLQEFIKPQSWEDLDLIAVAAGPGGFTGTRIGMVTARTLGQQLNIPVFAISTLAAIAWSQNLQGTIVVTMPARRGQLFIGIYQVSPENLIVEVADTITTPENLLQILQARPKDYHIIEVGGDLGKNVHSILELAFLARKQGKHPLWYSALPFYGQQPVD